MKRSRTQLAALAKYRGLHSANCSRCSVVLSVIVRRLGIIYCPGCETITHFHPRTLALRAEGSDG